MFNFETLGKYVILTGIFIVILGLLLTFWNKIPFLGKLPGDIIIEKGNFQFFFPIATGIVISIILTIVINIIIRFIGK